MREIKFRAWDTILEKMAYDVQNEYDTITGVLFEDGEEPGESSFASYLHSVLDYNYPEHRYIVEQYIGQKDKNGKEIYEGDILVMDIGGCLIEGEVGYTAASTFEIATGADTYLLDGYRSLEVLGNIHQPPKEAEDE